jgi:ATP-GRASP peptide maturase of grasp-with-spasm system
MLIIGSEYQEHSTNVVIDWLLKAGHPFLRVNGEEFEKTFGNYAVRLGKEGDTLTFSHQGKKISLDDISGFWFRRTQNDASRMSDFMEAGFSEKIANAIWRHLNDERNIAKANLFDLLKDKPTLGNHRLRGLDKLATIKLARKHGFSVPESLITGEKAELGAFLEEYPNLITKPLSEVATFETETINCGIYTSKVTPELFEQLPDHFHPALFQEAVEKYCELRIFYMAGECYSMAIFSQADQKTSIDFRNYNQEFSNPSVPFALPEAEQQQIDALMRELQLSTGSIDIIYTPDKEYVFLEINPVGQFGMVSAPCNYYIEKKIADFFIQNA